MQARLNSLSSNSLKGFGIITSTGAGKVALMWGIDILEAAHFFFFSLEA